LDSPLFTINDNNNHHFTTVHSAVKKQKEIKENQKGKGMDQEKIKAAVRLFLEGIGEDVNRPGLLETPDRIARMCTELYGGLAKTPDEDLARQFDVEGEEDGLVLVKDIAFYSTCEHHLVPFYGKAHIAYLPGDKVVGLSKLARTVEIYARRPQIQERLTRQIADAVARCLKAKGVMVAVEAEHMCMTMRGIKKPGAKTFTLAARGVCETDKAWQQQFLELIR
jgi:GTP cyclohydrolase I